MADIESAVLPGSEHAGPVGNAAAPFIYFDYAPTFGVMNGVLRIELAADTIVSDDRGTRTEVVWVAHLRGSVGAAASLRDALDRALGMFQEAFQQSLKPPADSKPN